MKYSSLVPNPEVRQGIDFHWPKTKTETLQACPLLYSTYKLKSKLFFFKENRKNMQNTVREEWPVYSPIVGIVEYTEIGKFTDMLFVIKFH